MIGFDARHNSDVFARDTAEIVQGAGCDALLLPEPLPTPVLAYAIRPFGCAAGVMVTASHNPPQDNGYKVYLGDGSQIVPPADRDIAAAIGAVGPVDELPRADDYRRLGDEVRADYVRGVRGTVADGPRDAAAGAHRAARGRRLGRRRGARRRGLHRPAPGRRAGGARPRLPDRGVPQPRGAGRDGPRAGAGRTRRRRPGGRQRPRRRPVCGGGAAARGRHGAVADAQRRRGRLAAGRRAAGAGPPGHVRDDDRLGVAARADGARARCGLCRDADRVQVAHPARGPRLRLRGGARLLRRPRPGPRQGRHQRAAGRRRPRGPAAYGGPQPARPAGRARGRLRAARHRPAVGTGHRPVADRRRDGPAARRSRRRRWAGSRSRRSTTSTRARPTCRPPTACGCGWSRRAGSWCGRRAPSPSSSATSRSSSTWRTPGADVDSDPVAAARIAGAGRLDAITADLSAALGL